MNATQLLEHFDRLAEAPDAGGETVVASGLLGALLEPVAHAAKAPQPAASA
jgi:hypothetical protein